MSFARGPGGWDVYCLFPFSFKATKSVFPGRKEASLPPDRSGTVTSGASFGLLPLLLCFVYNCKTKRQ
jgi:hypothetical protein